MGAHAHDGRHSCAIAGPDALCLRTPVETRGEDLHTVAEFAVDEGERVPFVLTWFPSHEPRAGARSTRSRRSRDTEAFWREWSEACPLELPATGATRCAARSSRSRR